MQLKKSLFLVINVRSFRNKKVKNKGNYRIIHINYIVFEQERADKSKVSENKLKERIFELEKSFQNEKDKLFQVTSEMNKQYKQMQDSLLKEINASKVAVKKKCEQIGIF